MLFNSLYKYKIFFIITTILSVLLSIFFLLNTEIRVFFNLPSAKIYGIINILIVFIFLLCITYLEKRIKKTDWLFIFGKKIISLFLAMGFLFFISWLKINGITESILASFFALTAIALFITSILFFLNDWLKKIDSRQEIKTISLFVLAGLIIIFIIFYTRMCFLRFNAGLSNLFDLGNMEQAIWNTLHGNFLRSTTSGLTSRLGGHFDIFLVFLAPIYALWSSPKMLILFQIIVLASGAWPLFLVTKKLLNSSLAGLVFVFAYLISPILGSAVTFDFHAVSLVTPFLFFGFYFLLEKRYIGYFIFIFLALTCKEEVSLLVFLLGIYVYFKHNKKVGIATSLLGAFWFILGFFIIIPYFAKGQYMFTEKIYGYLGTNKLEVIRNAITKPGLVINNLWDIRKLTYFFYLVLPFGGLMFFSSFTLLGLPSFLMYILSDFSPMFSGGYHYSVILLFYLIIGSILGIKFWLRKTQKHLSKIIYCSLSLIFFSSLLFGSSYFLRTWGPLSQSLNIQDLARKASLQKPEIEKVKKIIEPDVSVSTSSAVGVYFAARKNIYLFPRTDDAKFIILEQPNTLSWPELSLKEYQKSINDLHQNPNYQVIYENKNYLVFKKN